MTSKGGGYTTIVGNPKKGGYHLIMKASWSKPKTALAVSTPSVYQQQETKAKIGS